MTVHDLSETAPGIERAVERLDLESAVRLLTGAAMFELAGDDTIGLAPMVFSDGPTGVRGIRFVGGRIAALLPNATLLASSWDPGAARLAGGILAAEARVQGVHVVLGPTVNLHRTPLGGRLFEAYAEDPLLTGHLAAAFVRGLQDAGVGASVKHFVANESETLRTTVDCRVNERTLREVYLLPFEIVVADAHPWTIMAAYNRVNGVASTEHDELVNGVLKDEWGYDGLVMSDWYATTSTAASANGGLDLVMPGPAGPWGDALVAAVRNGEVAETTAREHLRRLLRLASRVGAFPAAPADPTAAPDVAPEPPDGPRRRAQLRELAAAGMTVLTDRDAVLPLDPAAFTTADPLLLVGRHARHTVVQGGGSAQVRPPHRVSIADGLAAALGGDRLRSIDGVEVRDRPDLADVDLVHDPETGVPGVRVTSRRAEGEEQASTVAEAAAIILNLEGGPHDGADTVELAADLGLDAEVEVEVGVSGVGRWSVELDGARHEVALTVDDDGVGAAVLHPPVWTVRVPARAGSRLVATLRDAGTTTGVLGLVARIAPPTDEALLAAAAEQAADVPLAVVVVGLTAEQETEALDKSTLALPGRQDALVSAVAAAARRTVVVVNAATPILMPWLDEVDAVLWAGLPGQEAGLAVADVLLGMREATGRLVTTFPRADGQGPAWSPVPVDGVLSYTDGVAVGHRGWHAAGDEPLFWFGHGLGWTRWEYHRARFVPGEPETVEIEIENVGTRTGREVVQVYLEPVGEPVRLVGWTVADAVAPGERRTVAVRLDGRVLRRWTAEGWTPLPGGVLRVARGLGDVRIELARR